MKRAVILFTRVPIAGKTKTRMMTKLDPTECARLHCCFLKDIAGEFRKTPADIFVFFTPEGKKERLVRLLGEDLRYFAQEGKDLGERMGNAVKKVLGLGYDACVLTGSDIPELRAETLKLAFRVLECKDVVLGPTADGGYYLIGMKRPHMGVFEGKAYGTGSVFQDTEAAAKQEGLSLGYTEMLTDMDSVSDLNGYRARMKEREELRRSATGRYLARTVPISVIIPVYNEAETIERLQEQLFPIKDRCEILFVDGGSTDGTQAKIRPEFRLLHSEKGRARQMNTGARASHGEILFFLHCDSELPPRPLEEIRRVMAAHRAGCFGIAFHSLHFFMLTCRVISNHRIKDRKIMFGDQGIFVERELFFEAGMFPELPVMEDYQFSLTLKKMGVQLGMARRRIYTSDRRFPKGTIPKLKLMWKMNRLRKMYRDQVPAETIAKLYRDVR